jgi:hypothetical protein
MIKIPRSLARHFRAVLRQSLLAQEARCPWPLLLCRSSSDGLALESRHGDLAVRYERKGTGPAEAIAFRASVLAEFEGRTDEPVALEQAAFGKGCARWSDRDGPRVLEFETVTPDSVPAWPELPRRWAAMPPTILEALGEAARTTAKEGVRFALTRVLLRGRKGEVVGTDGRQLLAQGGFRLPWAEDVLVPRVPAFGSRELPAVDAVGLARTKSHVAVRVGPWTFALAIDTAGRYPDVDGVAPRLDGQVSRLCLDPADAAFLAATLPKLPGGEADHCPVTLDLGTTVAVRARENRESRMTEAVLARSTAQGPPVCLAVDRRLLHRALKLGFTEMAVAGADKPLVCREENRTYLWMPLGAGDALPHDPGVLRIASADTPAGLSPPLEPTPSPERSQDPMPASPSNGRNAENGHTETPPPERWGIHEVIAEAEALRGLLQEAAGRTARLLAALKQQRRHSRAVQQAMQSLKQLQLEP